MVKAQTPPRQLTQYSGVSQRSTDLPLNEEDATVAPFPFWRILLVVIWLAVGGAIILLVYLYPRYECDVYLIPPDLASWLDSRHTILREPIALGYAIIPSALLYDKPQLRLLIFGFMVTIFTIADVGQIVLYSRTSAILDFCLSIVGALLAWAITSHWQAEACAK